MEAPPRRPSIPSAAVPSDQHTRAARRWCEVVRRGYVPTVIVADPAQITPDWLTETLHAAGVGRGGRVIEAHPRQVGTGQMARNFRFELVWSGDAAGAPRSVVAKVPSDDPTSRATGSAIGAYRKEVEFYRQVAPTVGIRTPHVYLALIEDGSDDFVLLMEDVAPAEQGDQLAGCSVERARLALDELAKLHAPRWDDPSLADLPFLHDPAAERAANLAVMYAALWPGFRDRYADRLAPELLAVADRLGPRIERWALATTDAPLTVVHGDYRLDNMLFGTGPGAPPLAVVDWQTVARGPAASDASYFIGAGLPTPERRGHEEPLLHAYWDALGVHGVTGYPWERCWDDYRRGGVRRASWWR